MRFITRLALPAGVAAVLAVFGLGLVASADPGTILRFDTMAPVTGPYVGPANPIRGMPGGGLPWMIDGGRGSLSSEGRLAVRVNELVLANRAPVPPALRGTNPIAQMKAVVSCLSTSAAGTATVTNVSTGTFPVSKEGDGSIRTTVQLPHPCIAPIVFVTSPGGAWFAATGN